MATAFSWLNSALLSKIFAAVCHALTLRLRGYRKFYVTMSPWFYRCIEGECDRKPCSFRKHRFLFAEVVLFIQFSTDFTQSTDPLVNRSRSPFRGMQSDWNELKQPTINICNLESPLAFGLVAVCKTPLFWACLIIFGGVSWKKTCIFAICHVLAIY